jgi:hypothetical protein
MDDGLWAGAEVEWVGPQRTIGGLFLEPGDRAVVIDPGRHHTRAFAVLSAPPAGRFRWRGGVSIRLAGGAEVRVPRRHLVPVAPEHPLRPEPDARLAEWWKAQLEPWGAGRLEVASFVPASFPAVAQVLHRWQRSDGTSATWREVAAELGFASVAELDATREGHVIPAAQAEGFSELEGELDQETAEALVEVLAEATESPGDVFVAVWEGWGDVPLERFPGAARLATEHRGHFLLRGPLQGVLTTVSLGGFPGTVAGLWWPADRAWFVATEIDAGWTFVAGSQSLVDRVLRHPRLESTAVSFDAPANRAADPS